MAQPDGHFPFLLFFRGWGTLAAVIWVATVISYLTGPVSAVTLRRTAPDLHRPLRLPGLTLISMVAFICATALLYWAKWPLTGEIILLIVVALPVYFHQQAKAGWKDFGRQLQGGLDLLVVGGLGLIFFVWGVSAGWRTPSVGEAEHEAHH